VASFGILGPIEANDGERSFAVAGRRQLVLFAFLLLHANQAVTREALTDTVWGPVRSGADNRLGMAIARLRKVLSPLDVNGEPRVRTVGGGYMLVIGPGELDADVFRAGVRDAQRAVESGDAALAVELLNDALALWRGPPLAQVAFEDFAQIEVRQLEELRLVAIETRVDAELRLGRHEPLVGELEALAAAEPTRERITAQLMLALYRSGRQTDALEVYQRTRARLSEELGLEPGPAIQALQTQILTHASSLQTGARSEVVGGSAGARIVHGPWRWDVNATERRVLPAAPNTTIGRGDDVESVRRLLAEPDVRLVTLTGTGGVGKTRLALEVAHALKLRFSDGVCWVELASVARPEDVASTILRALAVAPVPGEPAEDALRRFLVGRRLLLVIDNFEHLLEAGTLLSDLQGASPGLRMVVTSREALNLSCEHRFVVAPLPVPAVSPAVSSAEIDSTPASALFVEAARRRDSRFSITAATAFAVARICARLDGLPLALELAAARTEMVDVEQIAARLEATIDELGVGPRDVPARQRTLHAAIEWSYRLLDPDQQAAFGRCALFAGGATLDAAQAITGAAVATIEALIAKSMLERRQHADGSSRVVMLETVRHYALERLAEDSDQVTLRRRHADYYLDLVERSAPRLSTHDQDDALASLDSEIDNIRLALSWALEHAPASSLRLAGHLGGYWSIRADADGLSWLNAALEAAGSQAPPGDTARALLAQALFLPWSMQFAAADQAARTALELYRQAEDHRGMSEAYQWLALFAPLLGKPEEVRAFAEAACEEAQLAADDQLHGRALLKLANALPAGQRIGVLEHGAKLLTQAGNYRDVTIAYTDAAWLALKEDRVSEARMLLDVALPAADRAGPPQLMMGVLGNIGLANLFDGDRGRAGAAFTRQLRLCIDHASPYNAGEGLAGLAAVASTNGRYEQAARLLGAARAMGYPPADAHTIDDRLEREYFAPARASYGIHAWQAEEQAGASLSYQQAIACAIAKPPAAASPKHDSLGAKPEQPVRTDQHELVSDVSHVRGRAPHRRT
jgi:predicted ATPase/DNA-binding SARP family transcriptional activator